MIPGIRHRALEVYYYYYYYYTEQPFYANPRTLSYSALIYILEPHDKKITINNYIYFFTSKNVLATIQINKSQTLKPRSDRTT